MRHIYKLPLFVCAILNVTSFFAVAQEQPTTSADTAAPGSDHQKEFRDEFQTTSPETLRRYQQVNGAQFAIALDPFVYTGPHVGPGLVAGYQGPLFEIAWPQKGKDGKALPPEQWPKRLVKFAHIRSIDSSTILPGSDPAKLTKIVTYDGPMGEIEFCFIKPGKFADEFVERWRFWVSEQYASSARSTP
jgi:hypothetical protein